MTPIIEAVIAERVRQDAQWGGAAHDDQHTTQDFAQFMHRRVASLATADDSQSTIETLVEIAALAIAAAERVQRKL